MIVIVLCVKSRLVRNVVLLHEWHIHIARNGGREQDMGHITLEQGTGSDTIGFHTNFSVPGSVQWDRATSSAYTQEKDVTERN